MRHRKGNFKLGRNTGHRRSLVANMLKSLIEHERIVTTEAKAKILKRDADKMVTLAKKNTLATRRKAIGELMVRFNSLTPKEARAAKKGDTSSYNGDRKVINKLFDVLGPRFAARPGGYTRLIKTAGTRRGDQSAKCIIEYLPE
ncbi:MAG: 50S ribosomal protein L17 [Simkaniaceae bacterium]|nr:50S ribosomal protein L17 [Candidatus Sacchlamyda saccharinae]